MKHEKYPSDLPEWVDDLTEPFWTTNTIRYYEPYFVKPKKTFDEFMALLNENFCVKEISPEDVYERNSWNLERIRSEKVWLVVEDENSEMYYEFLKVSRPVQFNERLIIFYEQEYDRFNSNCTMLLEWMLMNRGIDQRDIDDYTPEFVAYFMAFWGYNEDLRTLNRYFEEQNPGYNAD